MADSRPIGLFDSGVGGLSVLLEIKKILPKESLIFLADQGHNPYGAKTKNQLINLSTRITNFLLKRDIKALVIACNTATCYALDSLRAKFKIPIIGVVPAVKPAVEMSRSGRIAIMSTPATAKSAYLSLLVSQHANKMKVLKLGCDGLEESVEYLKTEKISKLLKKYLARIKKFDADVIVLGCTHFPFLKKDIQKQISKKIEIIDSGEAIARRLKSILSQNKATSSKNYRDIYFTTKDPLLFSQVASKLLNQPVNSRFAKI